MKHELFKIIGIYVEGPHADDLADLQERVDKPVLSFPGSGRFTIKVFACKDGTLDITFHTRPPHSIYRIDEH
jgi:hypothetical protein